VDLGQDVDALFGPLWEAADLPDPLTYAKAGAQTIDPPAIEAEVQAVTERLGESMPSTVARLAGERVSHNSPGYRRLYCPVTMAAGPSAHLLSCSSSNARCSSQQHPAMRQLCTLPYKDSVKKWSTGTFPNTTCVSHANVSFFLFL